MSEYAISTSTSQTSSGTTKSGTTGLPQILVLRIRGHGNGIGYNPEYVTYPVVLKLLTWNISFNRISAKAPPDWSAKKNLDAMMSLIRSEQPDFIGLQEMPTDTFQPAPLDQYNATLSIRTHSFYTTLYYHHQWTLLQQIKHPTYVGGIFSDSHDNQFFIFSCHFPPYKEKAERRYRLMDQLLGKLDPNQPLIIMGDMNMRKDETAPILDLGVKDAWIDAGSPEDNKFSWNSIINPHQKGGFGFNVRFDRVFVRNFEVTEFRLIGNTPFGKQHYLSDHFGIATTVEFI